MSFILDALRKSDAERQRAATPGLADVRYAGRPSRRNIWLPILVVVLLVNLVFMGVHWFGRRDQPPSAATEASQANGSSTVQAPGADPRFAGTPQSGPAADAVRPLARENEFAELRPAYTPEQESQGTSPPVRVESSTEPAQATAPMTAPTPATAAAAPPAPAKNPYPRITPEKTLPTIEQAVGEGKLNIPMLNLDLHVYSDNPANRFVVINSHRYREGDKLAEGPVVESITADGVILDSQGLRFTLARK